MRRLSTAILAMVLAAGLGGAAALAADGAPTEARADAQAGEPPSSWTPTEAQVEELERQVRMPGSQSLQGFSRLYRGVTFGGRRFIRGRYERPGSGYLILTPQDGYPLVAVGAFSSDAATYGVYYDVDRRRLLGPSPW
ncbi:MAG: hypothetical protein WCY15_15650 [Phenylobacterium sp.]|uniref:hypothetical protein n=1 Tax=Phenylobacterium sp. TaxID=1871053 RepID=UPI002A25C23A|nr:hypothetical protein [Phenylobacterium sp.]MDD3837040.1 hypothetical protein [Phenylobacterium sp.]MDX9996739.1 hypothetical protein [Phenylobacterium sp.]